MGDTGLEHPSKTLEKSQTPTGRAAESDVIDPRFGASDPDLTLIVEWWARLPEAMRAGIVAMVRATGG